MSDNTKSAQLNYSVDEINQALDQALNSTQLKFIDTIDTELKLENVLYLEQNSPESKLLYNMYMLKQNVKDSPIWDGSIATGYSLGGEGTEENPYLISNGQELAYAITTNYLQKRYVYYKIINNIYLNNVDAIDWKTGDLLLENYQINEWFTGQYTDNNNNNIVSRTFSGSIDGNGCSIYGLYKKITYLNPNNASNGIGLIPLVGQDQSITIKNLLINYAYLDTPGMAGGIVGVTYKAKEFNIDRCGVKEHVTIKGNSVGALRGGVTSASNGGMITNCYSLATLIDIDASSLNYGLIGMFWDSGNLHVSNCYNANGPISSHNHTTDLISENNFATVEGLKEGTTIKTANQMQGLDVFNNTNKMPNLNRDGAYIATQGYPELKIAKIQSYDWITISEGISKDYIDQKNAETETVLNNLVIQKSKENQEYADKNIAQAIDKLGRQYEKIKTIPIHNSIPKIEVEFEEGLEDILIEINQHEIILDDDKAGANQIVKATLTLKDEEQTLQAEHYATVKEFFDTDDSGTGISHNITVNTIIKSVRNYNLREIYGRHKRFHRNIGEGIESQFYSNGYIISDKPITKLELTSSAKNGVSPRAAFHPVFDKITDTEEGRREKIEHLEQERDRLLQELDPDSDNFTEESERINKEFNDLIAQINDKTIDSIPVTQVVIWGIKAPQ